MSSEVSGADKHEMSAAYVLHTRKYRDTSLIAELYIQDKGRVAVVAKGARSKRGAKKANWQPFTPMLVSYLGHGELKTVTGSEFSSSGFRLTGENLIIGLYINELMVRLLAKDDPLEHLFGAYQNVLKDLLVGEETLAALRKFELFLLSALGYGINFEETSEGDRILPNIEYGFRAGYGFYPATVDSKGIRAGRVSEPEESQRFTTFTGSALLGVANEDFSNPEVGNTAKVILRSVIHQLLGGKPLKSRELFVR